MKPFLTTASFTQLGLHEQAAQRVSRLAQTLVNSGEFPALAIQIQRAGQVSEPLCLGSARLSEHVPVTPGTRFLVASLTKPVVAMAVLLLAEEGRLRLHDRVADWLPQFSAANKRSITIRHLLSHTSGLPDMLPNNRELRMGQASLDKFVAGTCTAEMEFAAGRGAQYQSMGYALLTPIVEAAAGQSLRDFLRERIFEPLEMHSTELGLSDQQWKAHPAAEVRVPEDHRIGTDWNWNSHYWQTLGAAWGGLISTVDDLSRFCRCMLLDGLGPHSRIFSAVSVRMATTNRLPDFALVPEPDRRTRGWGYGWRMNWLDHRSCFSDFLPASAYGHWGATGTVFWLDRERELAGVLLSTQAIERNASHLTSLTNAIVSALD